MIYSPISQPKSMRVSEMSVFKAVERIRTATRRARPRILRRTLVSRLSVPSVNGKSCGKAAAPAVNVRLIVWSSEPSL